MQEVTMVWQLLILSSALFVVTWAELVELAGPVGIRSSAYAHGNDEEKKMSIPGIAKLEVNVDIHLRFAQTRVEAHAVNPLGNVSTNIDFSFNVPHTAFVSSLTAFIENKYYKAVVEERNATHKEFVDVVALGESALHMSTSVRNGSTYQLKASVNVKPNSSVVLYLDYNELLVRQLNSYDYQLHIDWKDPMSVGLHPKVIVNVNEVESIRLFRIMPIGMEGPSVYRTYTLRDKLTQLTAEFIPSEEELKEMEAHGIEGIFTVQYDVDRSRAHEKGEIYVDDGIFMHYFAKPVEQPVHTVFLLDNGLDAGDLSRAKTAMINLLSLLTSYDIFSIIEFHNSTGMAKVWDLQEEGKTFGEYDDIFAYPANVENGRLVQKKFNSTVTHDSESHNNSDVFNTTLDIIVGVQSRRKLTRIAAVLFILTDGGILERPLDPSLMKYVNRKHFDGEKQTYYSLLDALFSSRHDDIESPLHISAIELNKFTVVVESGHFASLSDSSFTRLIMRVHQPGDTIGKKLKQFFGSIRFIIESYRNAKTEFLFNYAFSYQGGLDVIQSVPIGDHGEWFAVGRIDFSAGEDFTISFIDNNVTGSDAVKLFTLSSQNQTSMKKLPTKIQTPLNYAENVLTFSTIKSLLKQGAEQEALALSIKHGWGTPLTLLRCNIPTATTNPTPTTTTIPTTTTTIPTTTTTIPTMTTTIPTTTTTIPTMTTTTSKTTTTIPTTTTTSTSTTPRTTTTSTTIPTTTIQISTYRSTTVSPGSDNLQNMKVSAAPAVSHFGFIVTPLLAFVVLYFQVK